MRIELVTIGDEILLGRTLNSNVSWMARELSGCGYEITKQVTLPDEKKALTEGLQRALLDADVVIATGGLGPTADDLTKYVAAELFGSSLEYREEIAEQLHRRFGKIASIQEQATVPVKALCLPNPLGTASGLVFCEKGKTLILLPGVPLEMQAIFQASVLSYLKEKFPEETLYQKTLHFSILNENQVDPLLRTLQKSYPEVGFGIYPDYGVLSVHVKGRSEDQVKGIEREFLQEFSPYFFSSPQGKIAEALQLWFVENHKTLSLAESCTGGALASLITEISGASDYFLGSLVTYSNGWKEKFLGVHSLQTQGAVSRDVVQEMLEGLWKNSACDYGIAVSGVAGPSGGTLEKPVGTVWAAIGKRGEAPEIGKLQLKGSRKTNIMMTCNILLGALYRKVTQNMPAFPLILDR